MPAPPSDARSFAARAVDVTPRGEDGVLLRIRPEVALAPLRAARFFMLRREDGSSPAIPRPFSVYRQPDGELEFLVKVMGRGTRALAECVPGTVLRVVGPLGNGWPTLDGSGDPWVMLAGGIGCAPFYMGIEQALAGMDGVIGIVEASRRVVRSGANQFGEGAAILFRRSASDIVGHFDGSLP